MANSNRSGKGDKPSKPRPDFPLYPHASGRWAKRVRGKIYYFGSWADGPNAALQKWLEQKDDLIAGRKPRTRNENVLSVQDACDHYLSFIDEKVQHGERSQRWLEDLTHTLTQFANAAGRHWDISSLAPEDFQRIVERLRFSSKKPAKSPGRNSKAKPKPVSPITVKNRIHRIKGMFNWLQKAGMIDRVPAFGTAFNPPDRMVIDRHRHAKQARYFTRADIRRLLRHSKETNPQMYAAILLAVNTGCQNIDVTTLEAKHLDLKKLWYLQPRSKKAKQRRAKLWRRTAKAIRELLKDRDDIRPGDLVFQAKTGGPWHGRNCLAKEFNDLKELAGIDYPGAGFQWIRHSFITEASQSGDIIAVQLACGHAERSITQNYIHAVYDPRLEAIAAAMEIWLIGDKRKG